MFVFDNKLYGIEQYLDQQILPEKERFYGGTEPASFFDVLPNWDYEKLAQAFGGVGYRVTTGKRTGKCVGARVAGNEQTDSNRSSSGSAQPARGDSGDNRDVMPAGLVAGERSALSALHHKRVALQAFN